MATSETERSTSLTFAQAIELSMSLADFERSAHSPGHSGFHLERMQLLAEHLDNVDKAVPTIHVAGTKGKGSTSALITSILTQAGYKVGLFTSPHLHTVCERVRVGLEPISQEDFASTVEQIWPAVETVSKDGGYGGVTFFEMMTAVALVHFRNVGADYQVMEVGLGGRLDSTNILTPEVSVITSISMDHMATLGDTIRKIASEKAGIIKDGVPCVIGPQAEPDAMKVFTETADRRNSELISVADWVSWKQTSDELTGQTIYLDGLDSVYDLHTPLLGDFQLENAATAVTAVEVLRRRGHEISEDAIISGVREVSWPGRFEVYQIEGKTVLLDGAHNPYSIRRLVENLGRYLTYDKIVLVFGALGGHSAQGMLEELKVLNPDVIAVQTRHPRSARAEAARQIVREAGLNLVAGFSTVSEGFTRALEMAGVNDLILCTGSLSVVGEALEEIHGIEPEIYENLIGPVNRAP